MGEVLSGYVPDIPGDSEREQREKVKLLQAGGSDLDEVMLARCRYQGPLANFGQIKYNDSEKWEYLTGLKIS